MTDISSQLVMEEAAEELDVSFLGVDSESLLVFGACHVVVSDGFRVRLKHA